MPRAVLVCVYMLASACMAEDAGISHCIPSAPEFYCAEYGAGHVEADSARDCADAGGTLARGPCAGEGEVGRCTQDVMGGEGTYLYAEVYYTGFAGFTYTDPSELEDLRTACVDLRAGDFQAR